MLRTADSFVESTLLPAAVRSSFAEAMAAWAAEISAAAPAAVFGAACGPPGPPRPSFGGIEVAGVVEVLGVVVEVLGVVVVTVAGVLVADGDGDCAKVV